MRIHFQAVALFLSSIALKPQSAVALKCGIRVTNSCLGEKDARYSSDVTKLNLKESNDIWANIEGLYIGSQTDFSPDGEEMNERDLGTGGTYDFADLKIFTNYTVNGSRLYISRCVLIKHNADGEDSVQLPGLFVPAQSYCKD